MCIRDRIERGAFMSTLFTLPLMSVHAQPCNAEIDVVHGGTCLLYTSDAADERSSVDLGGRRIIKKKNTHLTAHRRSSVDNSVAHHRQTTQ